MQVRSSQMVARRGLESLRALKFEGAQQHVLAQQADSFLSQAATAAASQDQGAQTYFASNALSVSRSQFDAPQTRLHCLQGALGILARGISGPAGLALSELGAEVLGSPSQASSADTEAATDLMRRASSDESLSFNSLGAARRTLKIIDQIDLSEGSQERVLDAGFRAVASGLHHPGNFTQNVAAELLNHAPFDAGAITMLT